MGPAPPHNDLGVPGTRVERGVPADEGSSGT